MSNKYELCSVVELLDILAKSEDVDLVKCRLYLVENTEGRGIDLKYCEQECDGNEGLLTTRKKRETLNDLSRRRRLDLNAGGKNVVGLGEQKLCVTAAEQILKRNGKVFVDRLKGIDKAGTHLNL